MWEVSVFSDSGREWRLIDDPLARVAIKAGGMSGMVATSAETRVSVTGRPGSRPVASRVESLAPSWTLVFIDRDGRGLGEDIAEWLAAWRKGVRVTVESSLGRLSTRGRALPDADEAWEFSPFSPRLRWGKLEMPWLWLADRPVWEAAHGHSGAGTVEIINTGDVPLSPSVSWSGGGKSLTVDGVTVWLPHVSVPAVMVLDHAKNCLVTDLDGVRLDGASAWSRTRALDLSVVVPPGRSEVISVSAGVDVMWTVGVKSPWR